MTGLAFLIFFYFKIFCLILSCGLLLGIIYYFRKLHLLSKWQERWLSWWGIVPVFSLIGKSRKEWRKIDKLLREPYKSSWKLAVLKAEAVVKKTLNLMGYSGDNFAKILEELKFRNYQNLEILQQLHNIREKIIMDKNFSLDQNRAREITLIYKKFWDELLDTL